MTQFENVLKDICKRSVSLRGMLVDSDMDSELYQDDDLHTACSLLASRYGEAISNNALIELSHDRQVTFDTCVVARARRDDDLKSCLRENSLQGLNFYPSKEFVAVDISEHFPAGDVECHFALGNSSLLGPLKRYVNNLHMMTKENPFRTGNLSIEYYAFFPVNPGDAGGLMDDLLVVMDNFTFADFSSNPMAAFNRVSRAFVKLDALNSQYHHEALLREMCQLQPLSDTETKALLDT